MANSSIALTEGRGDKNLATHSFTETTTKEVQRIELNNSSGTEIVIARAEFNILAQASGSSATRTSADFTSGDLTRGILIHVKTANRSSTITFTPSVQWKTYTGNYLTIWTAASAIAANGDFTYFLAPLGGGTVSASFTESKSLQIPKTFRLLLTVGSTGTMDTLVDGVLLP